MAYKWKYIKTIEDANYYYISGLSNNLRYSSYLLKTLGYLHAVKFVDTDKDKSGFPYSENSVEGILYTPFTVYGDSASHDYGEVTKTFYTAPRYETVEIDSVYYHEIYQRDLNGNLLSTTRIGTLEHGLIDWDARSYSIGNVTELSSDFLLINIYYGPGYDAGWVPVALGATEAKINPVTWISYYQQNIYRHINYNEEYHFQNYMLYDCYWNGSVFVTTTNDGPIRDTYLFTEYLSDYEEGHITYNIYGYNDNFYMQPINYEPLSGTYNFLPQETANILDADRNDHPSGFATEILGNGRPVIYSSLGKIWIYDEEEEKYMCDADLEDWRMNSCEFIEWNNALINGVTSFTFIRYFEETNEIYAFAINKDNSRIVVFKKVPAIGSALCGPNAQGGFKTNNKYGRI